MYGGHDRSPDIKLQGCAGSKWLIHTVAGSPQNMFDQLADVRGDKVAKQTTL